MLNVLYINHEYDTLGGCTHSLVNLMHAVREDVHPIVLLRAKGVVYDYLLSLGFECVVVPFKLNILPRNFNYIKYIPRYLLDSFVNFKAIKRLERIIRDNHIDLIHSNTGVLILGALLSKATHIPHVWHLREFQDLDFKMRPFCGWKRFYSLVDRSDAVISITRAIEQHFRMCGKSNSFVYNDAVRSLKDACDEPKENYFLFCGRVSKAKGADDAVRIFSEFCKVNPSYRLKFAGIVDDEYKKQLLEIPDSLEIKSKIDFLGYCNDVKSLMSKASCFLMTSMNEAQGRVTVEAMFYGTPVLARNSGGTTEFVIDGYNGLLFYNVDDAVHRLISLLDNNELQKKIISNAHNTAVEIFSEEVYAEHIMHVYQQVIKNESIY
jgi:glycosyltransferase involved in cell wall biosynthesis